MNARHAYILLNSVPGIGPVTVKKLCDALGSPERIFEASAARLSAVPGVGPKAVEAILSHPSAFSPEREEAAAAVQEGRRAHKGDRAQGRKTGERGATPEAHHARMGAQPWA